MRITEKELYMLTALNVAKRSTCARLKVGAVLIKDKRIVSHGYNGTPQHREHCEDFWKNYWISNIYLNNILYKNDVPLSIQILPSPEKYDAMYNEWLKSKQFYDLHGEYSRCNEIHAEMNCIMFAERKHLDEAILFTSLSPCIQCGMALVSARITGVYYNKLYERDQTGIQYLKDNKIFCEQYNIT